MEKEFKEVPISIEGFNLSADLKEFPLDGFDVILGMDWLEKYQTVIHCHDHKVVVKGPKGERISYSGLTLEEGIQVISAIQRRRIIRKEGLNFLCHIHEVKGEVKLEDIPIVRKFPDVFPKGLPGISPKRDIEFNVDLLPKPST